MDTELTMELNLPESTEAAVEAQDKQKILTFPRKKRQPGKKKKLNADIVYMKGSIVQSMPPLTKQLSNTGEDGIIGLKYVWECRSPSKTVPPHYQCKLCLVSCTQNDMISHIKSWKHSFKYMKKFHQDKFQWRMDEVMRDPALKKKVKEVALEIEKIEGRGKPRVVLIEPWEVPAFQGLVSAIPRIKRGPGMGPGPQHFGSRYSDQGFPTDYTPLEDPPNYQGEDYREPNVEDFSYGEEFCDTDLRSYTNERGNYPPRDDDYFGADNGRLDYGRSGHVEEKQVSLYPDYRVTVRQTVDGPVDKPEEPQSQSTSSTLLSYLDGFRIENENDAQLVLKVTQKLTDALMEYRLRSISGGSSLSSSSVNSTDVFSSSSRFSNNDRYSSSFSDPPGYYDNRRRYHK